VAEGVLLPRTPSHVSLIRRQARPAHRALEQARACALHPCGSDKNAGFVERMIVTYSSLVAAIGHGKEHFDENGSSNSQTNLKAAQAC